MTAKEFIGLVESIRRHGLVELITLSTDGETIVDGRERYLACIEAGVEPEFKRLSYIYTNDKIIAEYIISMNVMRQHLNEDQRAAIEATIDAAL